MNTCKNPPLAIGAKQCSKCKIEKTYDKFRFHNGPSSRIRASCSDCDNLASRTRRKKNPEKYRQLIRKSHLKIKYGLSLAGYSEKLKAQGGACAICLSPDPSGNGVFAVDHNHSTNQVRGLLCQGCNQGLGQFREDITSLRNAINYLVKYRNL